MEAISCYRQFALLSTAPRYPINHMSDLLPSGSNPKINHIALADLRSSHSQPPRRDFKITLTFVFYTQKEQCFRYYNIEWNKGQLMP